MVTTTEIALLLLVLVLLFGADTVIKIIKPLIVDAVVGVIILLVANLGGLGVANTRSPCWSEPSAACPGRYSSSSWRTSTSRSPG